MYKQYETVFIATPVLTEEQLNEVVAKFEQVLKENSAEIVSSESWGMRNLAYPIQRKSTGFYHLIEFQAEPTLVAKLETEYKRDERIMRFLTTVLDKYAIEFNTNRRAGKYNKKRAPELDANGVAINTNEEALEPIDNG